MAGGEECDLRAERIQRQRMEAREAEINHLRRREEVLRRSIIYLRDELVEKGETIPKDWLWEKLSRILGQR